jgi:hypothetical protein
MASRNIAGKVLTGLTIIVFLFFGLKSCVITVWNSPEKPKIYSMEGQDHRAISMIFMPKNETMIWYFNPDVGTAEGVLTKMRGTYGTHYAWRIWHIEGPGVTFGYRIYPAETRPVNMEITVLERFMSGKGNPSFPDKGDRTHQVILFGKDVVKFQSMWLRKMPDNPEMVQTLLRNLGGSKEK